MPDDSNKMIFALAGNPNAGKTTLFNLLTGSRQHVGNYPGITVEKKEGIYRNSQGIETRIVDLPGTYSLTAYSVEEVVARNVLVQEKPDIVINIVDASNLQRNLYLTIQLLELGCNVIIALNMMDIARQRGMEIDADRLSELLGIPVCPIIARDGTGVEELMGRAMALSASGTAPGPLHISYGDDVDNAIRTMETAVRETGFMQPGYPPRWLCVKYLEEDREIIEKGRAENRTVSEKLEQSASRLNGHMHNTMGVNAEAIIADQRYGFIRSVLSGGVIRRIYPADRLYASDRIDQVLTNRIAGPVIMFGVLFGLYQFTFSFSEAPVEWINALFSWMAAAIDSTLPDGLLKSMLVSGIINGVGGVMGFVPLIMLMFLGIAVLEDSGYLARVAFMMDRVFRIFGLHGSSVMAFIISGGIAGGCAVPGVMATRTLRSRRERIATLLTVPFMNCGAKIPVLALLTGTFFQANRALMMFLLTLLAWTVALCAAKLLRMTVLRGASTPFVMELPPYRLPTIKGLAIHTWERTWQYMKKAGTVILAISILLWAMMTFPGLSDEKKAFFQAEKEKIHSQLRHATGPAGNGHPAGNALPDGLHDRLKQLERMEAAAALEASLAGRTGLALEKITKGLTGFDWRTNIALLGGFAAKEVVISTLGTAYSLGDSGNDDGSSLADMLASSPEWNPVKAMSVIVFVLFYAPCFVTVTCIAKESGSWKWGLFSIFFNTSIALVLSSTVFHLGNLMF